MTKGQSEGAGEYYQHYPRLAVVVTARAGGRANAMPAAWHSPLSMRPPLFGVSISPRRFTAGLILKSGEFGVNFVSVEVAELIASVGGCTGHEVDKFARFNIATEPPLKTQVPVLAQAYAAFECRLTDHRDYGDHIWFVGEVVATHLEPDVVAAGDVLDIARVTPLLYLGSDTYVGTDGRSLRRLDRRIYGQRQG